MTMKIAWLRHSSRRSSEKSAAASDPKEMYSISVMRVPRYALNRVPLNIDKPDRTANDISSSLSFIHHPHACDLEAEGIHR